jgi:hypothetical protein
MSKTREVSLFVAAAVAAHYVVPTLAYPDKERPDGPKGPPKAAFITVTASTSSVTVNDIVLNTTLGTEHKVAPVMQSITRETGSSST